MVKSIVSKASTVLLEATYGCVPTAVFLHRFFLRLLIRSLGHFPKIKPMFPCSACRLMSYGSIWLLVAPDATGIMHQLHCHGPHHVYKFAELVVCLNPTSKLLCKSSKMVQHGPRQYSIMLAQVYETEESKVNGSKQSAMSSNLAVINFAPQKQI